MHAAGEWEGQLYLAMRFLDGPDLAEVVRTRGPLPPAEVIALLAPIADALDVAHARGIVHRDVTPSNIRLDARGIPYLTDFGLTKRAATSGPDRADAGADGDAGLHGARAVRARRRGPGAGSRAGAARRRLRPRLRARHAPDRHAALPAGHLRGRALGTRPRGPARRLRARAGPPRHPRCGGRPGPRQGSGRPLPDARRPRRRRARGARRNAGAEAAASPTGRHRRRGPRRGARRPRRTPARQPAPRRRSGLAPLPGPSGPSRSWRSPPAPSSAPGCSSPDRRARGPSPRRPRRPRRELSRRRARLPGPPRGRRRRHRPTPSPTPSPTPVPTPRVGAPENVARLRAWIPRQVRNDCSSAEVTYATELAALVCSAKDTKAVRYTLWDDAAALRYRWDRFVARAVTTAGGRCEAGEEAAGPWGDQGIFGLFGETRGLLACSVETGRRRTRRLDRHRRPDLDHALARRRGHRRRLRHLVGGAASTRSASRAEAAT